MRFMNIPAFTDSSEITDLRIFYESRLASGRSAAGSAGIPLLGYMGWPNDPTERKNALAVTQEWFEYGEIGPLTPALTTIQQRWARVADIVHLHQDIANEGHQEKRGGTSVSKAIHLLSKNSKSKGTGEAQLWKSWKTYKDVAHIIAAAVIISADMKERHKRLPLDLTLRKLLPFRITLLMPELVVGLAMSIERYGLQDREDARSLFDIETLWRIPSDIGVTPLPLPRRALRPVDLGILKDRRSGNRGRRHHHETTLIL